QQPPVAFATPPPQMNPTQQPPQPVGPYYQPGRPSLPSNPVRVQPSSAPQPIPPPHGPHQTHIFQSGSPMMVMPQQPMSFNSQGPAYFIPGQYRSPYVPPQQYQVAGSPGFYPGTSPGEYAGTYYPAQPQYSAPVPAAPVIMNPTPQQPQAPPSQTPQAPPKRERKQIRIRDPNQGGRDITEEIMSGGRSSSTPPQVPYIFLDTRGYQNCPVVTDPVPPSMPPPMAMPIPPGEDPISESPPPPVSPISDAVCVLPTAPPLAIESCVSLDTTLPQGIDLEELVRSPVQTEPSSVLPPQVTEEQKREESVFQAADITPLDSPIAQPEELPLYNVPSGPGTYDHEATQDLIECDISPIAEPDVHREAPMPVVRTAAAQVTEIEPLVMDTVATIIKSAAAPEVTAECHEVSSPSTVALLNPVQATSGLISEVNPVPVTETVPLVSEAPPTTTETHTPVEEGEHAPAPAAKLPESTMQASITVPKKKRKMKELNKREVVGDLLDAFKEVSEEEPCPIAPPVEDVEETWEEKEDKLDAENIKPQRPEAASPTEQKYQYKAEQWKPLNPEEKKKYDREFLLGFQFIGASMHKPEGLPQISDVVLDKANKTPLRQLDPSRLPGMNSGPDFTPSFANLGRQPPSSGLGGPRRSGQGSRREPRKIITTMSLSDDVQLNKAEKAWKPQAKCRTAEEDDHEVAKTQDLFRRVRSVLNKLTPQMFQPLMKQVTELTIDNEERLKGVIDLIFEKAISEPNFSVAYANMCRCLMGLKVPTVDKPGIWVNFRKLLLNHCQKEFEKDKDDDEIFEKKQKELEAASGDEESQRLKEELEEAKDKARRRSLGNIKFIGELFKLKMLTEAIMHDCVVKLLKNHDEESLECLCRLLSTIGKDLDFEKAKPRMDQYFNQMEKIIKERKTSSRIRFMLQDLLDLRRNTWVPRRGDQGPKTIEQIHKEAELEEHREQVKVLHLMSKKDARGVGPGGHRSGPRTSQPPDEGWNTVPISSKNRPIDPTRLSKITMVRNLDNNNLFSQLVYCVRVAQDSGRTSTLNRFSALQQPSSSHTDSERRTPQRNSSSRERGGERFDRRDDRHDDRGSDRMDRPRAAAARRNFSRDKEDRESESSRLIASTAEDQGRERDGRNRTSSKENVKRVSESTPPPITSKPALSEEELERKSTAIIEEYLHINDLKEALQCVSEMNSMPLLHVFVRTAVESTLERSTITREHMGILLQHLIMTGTMPTEQYYKGLQEILEVAEDMAIDIPHIWRYLAEIISPMLHEGGIPMGQLFREVAKTLMPLGKAGVLLAEIFHLLCQGMSHKKVCAMWTDAGLSWREFLPEDEDVNKFVTDQGLEYTVGEESKKGSSKKIWNSQELSMQLDQMLQDKVDNQLIFDWVEANLDEQQTSSSTWVRALMTSVCQAVIICENPYKLDTEHISQRAKLLQRYIKDDQNELQALYALQSLMVQMEQPPSLLRMFFDMLYDEDVIKEEGFYKWESSKDPAEQVGKGVALKSVTAFFTWLREAEDESDNS
uniref:Eukaryotic translation initiation factor 4 gamma 1 n=1 Tax=Denticeps clupeoides TaxID=299321 RepID=A0AAY4E845_9TELE